MKSEEVWFWGIDGTRYRPRYCKVDLALLRSSTTVCPFAQYDIYIYPQLCDSKTSLAEWQTSLRSNFTFAIAKTSLRIKDDGGREFLL